jgi:5-methyltetrahydropteroyltriglutamate--homocysteine methyltransferase
MNAPSPGVIAMFQPNDYYATQDDYREALVEATLPGCACTSAGAIMKARTLATSKCG